MIVLPTEAYHDAVTLVFAYQTRKSEGTILDWLIDLESVSWV